MSTLELVTLTTAIIGAITGVGGLVLGVKNRRHSLREAKTKMRVLPKLAFPGPMDEMVAETYYSDRVASALKRLKVYFCIEVINLSAIQQTILELGVVDADGKRTPWREPEWMEPVETFPMSLKPDQAGAAYIRIMPDDYGKLKSLVYVKTDCGEYFEGESPIITDFLARLEEERPKPPMAVRL